MQALWSGKQPYDGIKEPCFLVTIGSGKLPELSEEPQNMAWIGDKDIVHSIFGNACKLRREERWTMAKYVEYLRYAHTPSYVFSHPMTRMQF